MRWIAKRVSVVLVIFWLVPAALSAQPTGLDGRINIELKEADLGETLQSFGAVLEAEEVVIDPAVSGTVTVTLSNVSVRTVLTAVCESVDSVWRLEDGVLTVELAPEPAPAPEDGAGADPLEQPIDLDLRDADLRRVLEAFGQLAGLEVQVAPEVNGTVTVEVNETPVREALDRLCKVNHCIWEVVEGEGGPVLRVRPE